MRGAARASRAGLEAVEGAVDMEISSQLVKELRERSGAGIMDCKAALAETGGNIEAALDVLQKKSKTVALKKAGRIASEGLVHSYIHTGGRLGVLIEVNCETDFVAKSDDFRTLVKDLSMQVAASNPSWVSREEIPADDVARQREIFKAQAAEQKKPPAVVEKIVEGKVQKWYTEACLLDQPFVKDPERKVTDIVTHVVAKTGENIRVRRFVRWQLGEGIEKRKHDLAAEVAAQVGG